MAERLQVPADYPAAALIVMLAGALSRRALIRPQRYDHWVVTPNLWGAIIGRSGVMKSPVLHAVLGPLRRRQAPLSLRLAQFRLLLPLNVDRSKYQLLNLPTYPQPQLLRPEAPSFGEKPQSRGALGAASNLLLHILSTLSSSYCYDAPPARPGPAPRPRSCSRCIPYMSNLWWIAERKDVLSAFFWFYPK